jgi:uncharacterized protein (TIGR02118 family)
VVRITILYPNNSDTRFDVDYYLQMHMPRSIALLGSALNSVSVEIGVTNDLTGLAPFAAICAFTCESVAVFQAAFAPHAAELQGDIENYTNAQAIVQVSELRMTR